MIDLYLAPTANGQRAAVALAECGIDFKPHKVDLAKGEQRTAEFLKLNPAGQIPVLVDQNGPGGKPLTLAQSGAIILYAAEKSGKYLPKDLAQRALALQWFMQGATDVSPTSGAIFQLEMAAPEKNEAITNHFKKRLLNFFGLVDKQLAGREHVAGELSIADFMIYPNYFARKALLDAAGGLENLHAWGRRMGARPGVTKGMNPFA